MPDLSSDSAFVKSFEIFRSENEEIIIPLTAEELACIQDRVTMRVVELRSLNPYFQPKNEPMSNHADEKEETDVKSEPRIISSDSELEMIQIQTPKKRKVAEIKDLDDIPGPSGLNSTFPKRQKMDPIQIENSDSDEEFFSYEPGQKEKSQREKKFEADKCESAKCPICEKYFDPEYIEEHTAACIDEQNGFLTFGEKAQKTKDDMRNRRYTKRQRINPLTGKLEKAEYFTPQRANEEEIQQAQMEKFQHEINKEPQPVRTMYPHFDRPNEPIQKCPICAFTYLKREIEEHGRICADRVFR